MVAEPPERATSYRTTRPDHARRRGTRSDGRRAGTPLGRGDRPSAGISRVPATDQTPHPGRATRTSPLTTRRRVGSAPAPLRCSTPPNGAYTACCGVGSQVLPRHRGCRDDPRRRRRRGDREAAAEGRVQRARPRNRRTGPKSSLDDACGHDALDDRVGRNGGSTPGHLPTGDGTPCCVDAPKAVKADFGILVASYQADVKNAGAWRDPLLHGTTEQADAASRTLNLDPQGVRASAAIVRMSQKGYYSGTFYH
jgi:hypothetical protein